jgi:hypothetical protein
MACSDTLRPTNGDALVDQLAAAFVQGVGSQSGRAAYLGGDAVSLDGTPLAMIADVGIA